ncbi:MAG: TMEM165/GDT1 family protein [Clostridia bacterium]|nr:TMEM165/GDT1 family protein [Clostridia bacterium]
MHFIYPFVIAFTIIFFSELGDKTQILVLSFSTHNKATRVLLGVSIGTFLSHGIAILLGSQIGLFGNPIILKIITYISFLFFGIVGFLPEKEKKHNNSFFNKLNKLYLNCVTIVALSIAIGELGDKTLFASIGLGIDYPSCKFALILGSIFGMVTSNSIAIFFGKLLGKRFSENSIKIISNFIFITFGIVGIISLLYNYFLSTLIHNYI